MKSLKDIFDLNLDNNKQSKQFYRILDRYRIGKKNKNDLYKQTKKNNIKFKKEENRRYFLGVNQRLNNFKLLNNINTISCRISTGYETSYNNYVVGIEVDPYTFPSAVDLSKYKEITKEEYFNDGLYKRFYHHVIGSNSNYYLKCDIKEFYKHISFIYNNGYNLYTEYIVTLHDNLIGGFPGVLKEIIKEHNNFKLSFVAIEDVTAVMYYNLTETEINKI